MHGMRGHDPRATARSSPLDVLPLRVRLSGSRGYWLSRARRYYGRRMYLPPPRAAHPAEWGIATHRCATRVGVSDTASAGGVSTCCGAAIVLLATLNRLRPLAPAALRCTVPSFFVLFLYPSTCSYDKDQSLLSLLHVPGCWCCPGLAIPCSGLPERGTRIREGVCATSSPRL